MRGLCGLCGLCGLGLRLVRLVTAGAGGRNVQARAHEPVHGQVLLLIHWLGHAARAFARGAGRA